MFAGTTTCGELCQPAASRISRAMAPGLTHLLISVRCLFMASMLTVGMTNAAPVPRASGRKLSRGTTRNVAPYLDVSESAEFMASHQQIAGLGEDVMNLGHATGMTIVFTLVPV